MILYRDYLSSKFLNQKHKFYLRFEVLDRSYDTGTFAEIFKRKKFESKIDFGQFNCHEKRLSCSFFNVWLHINYTMLNVWDFHKFCMKKSYTKYKSGKNLKILF